MPRLPAGCHELRGGMGLLTGYGEHTGMSSKFFTNEAANTLFDKFSGIAKNMADFHSFHAVAGFFRLSGYFKLRKVLDNVEKIQILVGINVDKIFRKHNRAMLMLGKEEDARNIYSEDFINDVKSAKYSLDVEQGILQFCEDLRTGKVEMKVHSSKNLHAKFYLCLPQNHSQHSDGWVIMGSSNISESGFGLTVPSRYELNVAMKDFDDVNFCKQEFDKLWEEGVDITDADIEKSKRQTHLGQEPTPYELYMKVLIDSFGAHVEDDCRMKMPDEVLDLKYQKDAFIQGYQMLCEYKGFFLADVVGLGKTIVATMIAQRFAEANGKDTNILVVYPPSLEKNWKETFKQFGLDRKAQFISNCSLSKIINGENNYKLKEEFNLVIVDEAHGFRNNDSIRYDELQRICKSPCNNVGLLKYAHKRVMLLSATPLNNEPSDLLSQILLFQNARQCTIGGINDIQAFFAPLIDEYKKIMSTRDHETDTVKIDALYEKIRNNVLDKITVRRTRKNIWGEDSYKKDLKKQHIEFPDVLPPNDLTYQLSPSLGKLFYDTLRILTNEQGDGLKYARYRGVEFLSGEHSNKFKNPKNTSENLAAIYRVHMVKRLESSFHAFRQSLDTLLEATVNMLKMFAEKKIIIAPDVNVKDLQAKGWELDRIINHLLNKKGYVEGDFLFSPKDFITKDAKSLVDWLESDKEKLEQLKSQWDTVTEDPKLDLFIYILQNELFDANKNPTGKLVVFSESVDTVNYLEENLKKKLSRKDILSVSSNNRGKVSETVSHCFDARYKMQSNEYNIIISSDVLAEGVNLHRANVIVNYDSPWNASRLMQRIGRVNRIGSVAGEIYNYMFYPSTQGDEQIRLYKNALFKLQGFHSALGEDAQIFSKEEILKEFKLFNPGVQDRVDAQLQLLREVRDLYDTDKKLYEKIKALPPKSRVIRYASGMNGPNTTIAFIQSQRKTNYYMVNDKNIFPIDIIKAATHMKAVKDEAPAPFESATEAHFAHVNKALKKFKDELTILQDTDSLNAALKDSVANKAATFLRNYDRITNDANTKPICKILSEYVKNGVYTQLTWSLYDLSRDYKGDRYLMQENISEISEQINALYDKYYTAIADTVDADNTEPHIVISETFV